MFMFSACEMVFMIAMSMNNFYSWQTYADGKEVVPLGFREAFVEMRD